MSVSTTAGSYTYQQPVGGISLAPECHIASYQVTAPVDAGSVTGFAVTIPGLTASGTRVIGLVAKSATAAALTGVYATVTANTLTITCGAGALAGSEVWDITFMTQI
jgi:hypothetical protein